MLNNITLKSSCALKYMLWKPRRWTVSTVLVALRINFIAPKVEPEADSFSSEKWMRLSLETQA